ncbi:hypothetical protein BB560_000404, partial [Smittium megazygosporum]
SQNRPNIPIFSVKKKSYSKSQQKDRDLLQVVMETKLSKKEASKLLSKLQAHESLLNTKISDPNIPSANLIMKTPLQNTTVISIQNQNTYQIKSPKVQNIKDNYSSTHVQTSFSPVSKLSPIIVYVSESDLRSNLSNLGRFAAYTFRLGIPTIIIISNNFASDTNYTKVSLNSPQIEFKHNRNSDDIDTDQMNLETELNHSLATEIEKYGGLTDCIVNGVFSVSKTNSKSSKLVQMSSDVSKILNSLGRNRIPIINTFAFDSELKFSSVPSDVTLVSLVHSLNYSLLFGEQSLHQSSNKQDFISSLNNGLNEKTQNLLDLKDSKILFLRDKNTLDYPQRVSSSYNISVLGNYSLGSSNFFTQTQESPTHPITFINLADEFPTLNESFKDHLNYFSTLYPNSGSKGDVSYNHLEFSSFRSLKFDYLTLKLANECLKILPPTSSFITANIKNSPSEIIRTLLNEKPASLYLQPSHLVKPKTSVFKLDSELQSSLSQMPKNSKPSQLDQSAKPVNSLSPENPTYTLIRSGFPVKVYSSLKDVNITKLTQLLELSFKRKLLSEEYYSRLKAAENASSLCIIVVGDYLGAAIVILEAGIDSDVSTRLSNLSVLCFNQLGDFVKSSDGSSHENSSKTRKIRLPYLDKFAVAPAAQGTGLADILWNRLVLEFPLCTWRSRSNNMVNKWYYARSDGHIHLHNAEPDPSQPPIKKPDYHWVCFWYLNTTYTSFQKNLIDNFVHISRSIPASFI